MDHSRIEKQAEMDDTARMHSRFTERAAHSAVADAVPSAVDHDCEVAEGVREVDERMAQIGLTPKTGWYTSIALYAIGGIPAMLMHLIDPRNFPVSLFILGAIATAMSPLSIIGLKYFPNSHRATHLRLTFGIAIITVGGILVGDSRQAFLLLPLVSALPPAIYYGVRDAVPYVFAVAAFAWFAASTLNESWAIAMAICSTLTVVTLTNSLMVAQNRTRKLARRHRELAYTDPLTGLANTRALNTALEKQLSGNGTRERLALFAIDLDNFKQVNDRFDHALGDEVLKGVAKELVSCGAPGDLFARRGGDEFSMVVTVPSERDLDALSRSLAEAIAHARRRICPEVSPSGSVAYVRARPGDTPGTILQRADDALHDAKTEFHRDDGPNRPVRLAVIDRRSESARAETEVMNDAPTPMRRAEDREREAASKSRLRGSKQVDGSLWIFTAVINLVIGVAIGLSALLGYTEPLSPLVGGLLALGLLAVAAANVAAGLWPLHRDMIHPSFGATLVLLSVAVAQAGPAGTALLDLYAIVGLFAFHFFAPRVAARYLVACIAIYFAFVVAGTYPFGIARLVVFSTMMLAGAVLTAKVRSVSSRFIRENQQLSQVDGLTGLANIRALRSRVNDVVANARGGISRPALIAADLDEFKQVNDSFSHTVGDQVLVSVARAIVENVRSEDLVARRGGDEFVVVTEIGDPEELERLAQRVREAVARVRGRICPQLIPSISVAVVHWEDGNDADAFMRRADHALHVEKLAFRERHSASSA